ncbi:hypothetical protein CCY99_06460 [Helicobacter sp. 16-1353]|uniref:c-type cytochrome n=1 Tax=Helicobacter sp. 16-1353 TaxID=2004996 RepID=UPI000DCB9946|nr:c-type cytochrome [Helicobacter sp. 16-1353]RAX53007.1 hypothetical protein CCY99_06460 [Helicobacter sp. 16-1353]
MRKFVLICIFSAVGLMAADGATIYKACAVCHGPNADKIPPGSKATSLLVDLPKDKIVEDLKGYKAKKLNQFSAGPIMWAQSQRYSEADMESVAEYIQTLKK